MDAVGVLGSLGTLCANEARVVAEAPRVLALLREHALLRDADVDAGHRSAVKALMRALGALAGSGATLAAPALPLSRPFGSS